MTLPEADYLPRSMQDAGVRERRRAMLRLDHITELTSFAAELRKGRRVPDFDPCDGGVNAQALFFLIRPVQRPKTRNLCLATIPTQRP